MAALAYQEVGVFGGGVIRTLPAPESVSGRGSQLTVSSLTSPVPFRTPESVFNALRGRGLRVSTVRRVVVHVLFEAGRPLSAEEIAGGSKGRWPQVDLSSVYRNLETLEELGAVRHFHAGHAPGRYVVTAGAERDYLACDHCGTLIDAASQELEDLRAQIHTRFGFEARFSHFPIVGRCSACAGEQD